MKIRILINLFLLISIGLSAQNAELRGTFSQGFSDLGTIKIQAEQGDIIAQIKLADVYLFNFKSSDALKWYEAAAKQHSVEGEYQLGNLLLFGRIGIPKEEQVEAKPIEGLKWTYLAATGSHKEAWRNMAKASQMGIGCSTNLVTAYAWLSLLADSGDIVGRVEMNNLVLKISDQEIIRGKSMAQEMKAGHWPGLPILINSKLDSELKLNGLIPGGTNPLATINGKTFAKGETISIKIKKENVDVKCLKINADSVLILVDGENEPHLLRMQ